MIHRRRRPLRYDGTFSLRLRNLNCQRLLLPVDLSFYLFTFVFQKVTKAQTISFHKLPTMNAKEKAVVTHKCNIVV